MSCKKSPDQIAKRVIDGWRAEMRRADDAWYDSFLRRLYESTRPRTAAEKLSRQQRAIVFLDVGHRVAAHRVGHRTASGDLGAGSGEGDDLEMGWEEFDGQAPLPPSEPRYDPDTCPVGYVAFAGRTFSELIGEIQELRDELRDLNRELRNLREQLAQLEGMGNA